MKDKDNSTNYVETPKADRMMMYRVLTFGLACFLMGCFLMNGWYKLHQVQEEKVDDTGEILYYAQELEKQMITAVIENRVLSGNQNPIFKGNQSKKTDSYKISEQVTSAITDYLNTATQKEKENVQGYTQEDVILLGDTMYAEVGVFLSTMDIQDARLAHLLTGSVVLNRLAAETIRGDTLEEIIFSSGYGERTKRLVRTEELGTPDIVYEWAEELLRYGPVGPRNLIFQAAHKQGTVYIEIGNEYFGLGNIG